MNRKISILMRDLKELGLISEALDISALIKTAASEEAWLAIKTEISKPNDLQVHERAISYIFTGMKSLANSAIEISKYNKESIDAAAAIISSRLKSAAGINENTMIKFTILSSKYQENIKTADNNKYKIAQMNYFNDAQKLLGTTINKAGLIPIIGTLFNILLAIKNIYYGSLEWSKINNECDIIDLNSFQILNPNTISEQTYTFLDDPYKLLASVKLTKSAKIFYSELIGFGVNSLDAIKDLIFLVLDILSMGGSIAIDVGISFLLLIIEWATVSKVHTLYDKNLSQISQIVEIQLESFAPEAKEPITTPVKQPQTDEEFNAWYKEERAKYLSELRSGQPVVS